MRRLLLVLALLLAPGSAGAATFNALSCSQADIAAAVGFASDGDTVTVPASLTPCTWTDTFTISKAITLQGAGIGQTVINEGRVRNPDGAGNLLTVNVPGGTSVFRLTGFSFIGGDPALGQGVTSDGTIVLRGCSTTTANYRIDNNRFNQLQNIQIKTFNVYGLIDHNISILSANHHLVYIQNGAWPRDGVNCTGTWGDGSWAFPLAPGTIKATYIEGNTVTAFSNTASAIVDGDAGARAVVRYNAIDEAIIGTHGADTGGRERGFRWLETYENLIHYNVAVNGADFAIWQRGGSGVHYSNHLTVDNLAGNNLNWLVKHLERRDVLNDGSVWNTLCDGSGEWDGNLPDPPNNPGYRCLDQPGAGTSVDWNDVTNAVGLGQAGNALEPVYVWNNDINGSANNCGVTQLGLRPDGCFSDGHVVVNRDIFYGTARPGYTPFTYPHPLTFGNNPIVPGIPASVTVT